MVEVKTDGVWRKLFSVDDPRPKPEPRIDDETGDDDQTPECWGVD